MWTGVATLEDVVEDSQKTENRTTIWSSNSNTRYVPQRMEIKLSKKYLHSHIHCSVSYSSQNMETIEMSVDRLMDKENTVYTYKGILFSL